MGDRSLVDLEGVQDLLEELLGLADLLGGRKGRRPSVLSREETARERDGVHVQLLGGEFELRRGGEGVGLERVE